MLEGYGLVTASAPARELNESERIVLEVERVGPSQRRDT
jgi:hypothetical protein